MTLASDAAGFNPPRVWPPLAGTPLLPTTSLRLKSHDPHLDDPWRVQLSTRRQRKGAAVGRARRRRPVSSAPGPCRPRPPENETQRQGGLEYGPSFCVPPAALKPGRNWGSRFKEDAAPAPHGSAYRRETLETALDPQDGLNEASLGQRCYERGRRLGLSSWHGGLGISPGIARLPSLGWTLGQALLAVPSCRSLLSSCFSE